VTADFMGKTALITGAGRGIGRAIALGLAGARVILLARTAAQLEETRALLRGRAVPAGRISVASADLSDEQDRGRAAAAVLAALHERFNRNYAEGTLITPEHSAAALLAQLTGDDTGAIWDVGTAAVGA
jgi:NAD(P)-dependent dehydrogenase (short-subunit alcohol dehydrogenase family)